LNYQVKPPPNTGAPPPITRVADVSERLLSNLPRDTFYTNAIIMVPPFEEVDISDADSISVTSTKVSDEDAEYAVEKILAEEPHHETGEMMYLIKWEGYPLHQFTWEPAENLLAPQILADWQRDKDAVEAGTSQPFDMESYLEIMERHTDEREERRERRMAKRKRLGLPSRSGSVANRSADEFEARNAAESSEDDEPLRGRQKQVNDPTPKRKSVAQKVKTGLSRPANLIISSDESSADGKGEDSLLKKSRKRSAAKASARQSVSGSKAAIPKPVASGAREHTITAASVTPATKVTQKRPSARSTAPAKKPAAADSRPPAAGANFAIRTQPSSSARKSAPSTASAYGNNATAQRLPVLPYDQPKRRAPANPFLGFGKQEPERKARKLSASNPKSQRFSNLAEENRVRKHSAKEAAPDPSVLGTFNFATNTYEPAMKPRAAVLSSTSAANNVFGRREAPAPARQRSISPPSTTVGARTALTVPGNNTTTYTKVCWEWRGGGCQNDRCTFAHHYITCPEWRQGKCPKREIDCKFDHKEEGRDPVFRSANEAWNNGAFFPGHNANAIPQGIVQPLRKLPRPSVPAPSLLPTGKQLVTFLKPKQIPCQYWARGMCFKSATDCMYPHYDTGAPSNPKEITCGYWLAHDSCKHSKRCKFAHHETAYSTLGPRNESTITCSFWLAGQCTRLRCEFAHYETGCRSLGPQGTAPIDPREVSPGEVVDDEPIAAHPGVVNPGAASPGHSHPGAARTTAAETIAAQTTAAQAIAAKIIAAAQTTDAQTTATETTAAQTQTGPLKVGVAPTANMTPASRRPSLPVPQNTDQLAFINDVALEVKFGDFCFTAATQLACATRLDAIVLNDAIGRKPQLFMEHTMDEKLLRTEVANSLKAGASFSTGDIICKDPRRDYAQTLADELRQISKCGIIQSPAYTMIVHPIGTGEWAFLTQDGDAKSSQAPLKFILLPALTSKIPTSNEVASEDIIENATDTPQGYSLTSADMERLLKISDIKTEDKVFIMMPPSKVNEMQRMAKAFEDCFKQPDYAGRETNVWTSQEKGEWEYLAAKLQRTNGGLLILDCELPLFDIPHLATVLHHTTWRIFSVGVTPHVADFGRPAPGPCCQRLFPMGDVVFVTDEVFINTPEKVLRIIDEVNRQNRGKPPGAPRAKIAARPGVKMWLMEFVTEHPQGASDPRWLKLLHAVWDLCPFERQSMFHPGNPSKEADMVSEPPDMMPTHQDYLDKGDKAGATDWIVNWFAGWAFINAAEYRRFTVCHEEPDTGKWELDDNHNKVLVGAQADPRGWAKQYGCVLCMTPDQWLEEKAKTKH
jgi:hypothetical protein